MIALRRSIRPIRPSLTLSSPSSIHHLSRPPPRCTALPCPTPRSPARTRQFSSSPSLSQSRPHPESFDEFVSFVCRDLGALHDATGLTWAALIPLTAVAVRALCAAMFQLPARQTLAELARLAPIKQATTTLERSRIMRQQPTLSPIEVGVLAQSTLKGEFRAMHKRWKIETYLRFLPFGQLPVFIFMADVMRRLAGAHGGLLSAITLGVFGGKPDGTEDALSAASFHPAMCYEGPAFCVDLTAADPTLTLPLAVSGLMLANLWYSGMRSAPYSGAPVAAVPVTGAGRRFVTGVLTGMAIAAFPLTLGMPAGVTLYWASSSASALVVNIWLHRLVPLHVVSPCKRPLVLPGRS